MKNLVIKVIFFYILTLYFTVSQTMQVQTKNGEKFYNVEDVLSITFGKASPNAPSLNSISPNKTAIGEYITIRGSRLGNTKGSSNVFFNNISAIEYLSWSNTEIEVIIPENVISGKVFVIVNGLKSNELDFIILPNIKTVTPSSAIIDANVTITGTSFGSSRDNNYCTFNRTIASEYITWNDKEISVKVPSGAEAGELFITSNGQISNKVNFAVLPNISLITPTYFNTGDTVLIFGTGFGSIRGSSFVSFNNITASSYIIWNTNFIEVIVPSGVVSGKLTVTVGLTSNEVDFKIIDEIKTVKIGQQVWMLKNLDVDHYRNGDIIPQVKNSNEWINLTTGAWCYYNNDSANGKIYGKLYNWWAVNDPRGIAPEGWHVASETDWQTLELFLGMPQSEINKTEWRGTTEGGKLKSTGANDWSPPNTAATNESGFTALPGGIRYYGGEFLYLKGNGRWWTSSVSQQSTLYAWGRILAYDNGGIYRIYSDKFHGYSVRCVKD